MVRLTGVVAAFSAAILAVGCSGAASSPPGGSAPAGAGGTSSGAGGGSGGQAPVAGAPGSGAGSVAGSAGLGAGTFAGSAATGGASESAGAPGAGAGGTSVGVSGAANVAGTSAAGASAGSNGAGAGGRVGGGGAGSGNLKGYIVITGTGTPTPGDLVMIGRIKAHGFPDLKSVTDLDVTPEMVAGSDLVVISSSAESGPLKAKLKDVALPVLVVEDAEYTLMGMATSGNHDAGVSQVTIVPAGAALVGTATGTPTFSSKPGDLGWGAGTNAATVVIGATMPGNPAHAAIFGYEKGAQMSGMVAPGKRAGFAIRETLAANLNADGLKLFDSILEWVLE
jgi:hypothetical protein